MSQAVARVRCAAWPCAALPRLGGEGIPGATGSGGSTPSTLCTVATRHAGRPPPAECMPCVCARLWLRALNSAHVEELPGALSPPSCSTCMQHMCVRWSGCGQWGECTMVGDTA